MFPDYLVFPSKFNGCSEDVSRVSQLRGGKPVGILKDILKRFECVSQKYQGCFFKDVSRKFNENVMCMTLCMILDIS